MCSDHTQPVAATMMRRKSHLVFTILLFFDFSLFSSVSSCAKLRLPAETSPRLCKTSQRPLPTDSWTLSQSATSEKTLSWKDGEQRESFKHKSYASTNPKTLLCCVILICNFSLIEKVNASVKYVIDDCSGYAICTYCCKRGIPKILILLI